LVHALTSTSIFLWKGWGPKPCIISIRDLSRKENRERMLSE
jgi:hypothetical protein